MVRNQVASLDEAIHVVQEMMRLHFAQAPEPVGQPLLFLFQEDGERDFIPLSGVERQNYPDLARLCVGYRDPLFAVLVSEVSAVPFDNTAEAQLALAQIIAQGTSDVSGIDMSEAREVLSLLAADRQGAEKSSLWRIQRLVSSSDTLTPWVPGEDFAGAITPLSFSPLFLVPEAQSKAPDLDEREIRAAVQTASALSLAVLGINFWQVPPSAEEG